MGTVDANRNGIKMEKRSTYNSTTNCRIDFKFELLYLRLTYIKGNKG